MVIWKSKSTFKPKVNARANLKDFRPITLTSVLCKIMERLIKQYIINHTDLDRHQFAYRSRRSTQYAILCLKTTITSFIDKSPSNYARYLFPDFSSAFNTINVEYLIPLLNYLDSDVDQVRSILPALGLLEGEQLQCRQNGSNLI